MSSRENILAAISHNKPPLSPLPQVVVGPSYEAADLIKQFTIILEAIGASVIIIDNFQEIRENLQKDKAGKEYVVNVIEGLGEVNEEVTSTNSALSLQSVHKVYIMGTLGVAENGAIWLEESKMVNRLLPFICQHLIIVMYANTIVSNMHEAYQHITIDREGYGVFLAGPSKTADIEQSLVIGAHGARSLQVYILNT